MNFREYATKLRTKAAAAASKIPTFDDMAAKDDYIHSEEFNVRGHKKTQRQDALHSGTGSGSVAALSDNESRHAAKSWSLLDGRGLSSGTTTDASIPEPVDGIQLQQYSKLKNNDETATQGSSRCNSSLDRESGEGPQSTPVLSVVSQAMATQHSKSQPAFSDDSVDSRNTPLYSDASSVDDSLSEGGSTDDPILSLMRAENGDIQPSRKFSRSRSEPKSKSSHRFMSDLEDRVSRPEQAENGLTKIPLDASKGAPAVQPIFPILKSPIGSWVQGVAKRQFQRLVHKSEEKVEDAPLARQPLKRPVSKAPEEEIHTAVSSSVLADDELAALAQLKSSSNMSSFSKVYRMFTENRQFGFILFTLLLAAYLYFFQRDEDSVTRLLQ
eukprot:Nitzschia sp. Nitz4//scaffold3_size479765//7319//8470//NITZ4_000005-RA/size479765-processed-gene-0.37-mRNA-1//1//CDS//3329550473//2595//frame0